MRDATPIGPRSAVAILAYGSLVADPGAEISPLIVERVETRTPFPVEYARLSRSRGGAPTVVPALFGHPVKSQLLVLAERVSLPEAHDLLWRRETRKEHTGAMYSESSGPNAVVIRDLPRFCGMAHVLYTDFNPEGKLANPEPRQLAAAAISSVALAKAGRDGISYLLSLLDADVRTELTQQYIAEIQSLTGASSLRAALDQVREKQRDD